MKKYLSIFSSLLVLAGCGNGKSKKGEAAEQSPEDSVVLDTPTDSASTKKSLEAALAELPDEPVFDIITNLGTITVKLYSDTPKHRDNFAKLALDGFYDKLLFHRVINGFMIQGGDPLTIDEANKQMFGTGGPGYNVPAEILPNHNHKKGALAAARRGDAANPLRESSGSQFYIVQDENACAQLDGQYTVYGETVNGFDVIDKIANVATDMRDCPENPVKIIKVKLHE